MTATPIRDTPSPVEKVDARRSCDERLAVLAHELRTPLSALASAAEVLARCARDQPFVRISEIVLRQTATMSALVEELLDASRVDTGLLTLRMRELDLRDVARNAVDDHREQFAHARLRCELAMGPQPIMVSGDAGKLGQVVGNLLSNAIKFTQTPGIVQVMVDASGGRACLAVRDTGVGVSAELLAVIFERYRQASRGSFGGLGLGLPIAKGLVELHGGEIHAFSDGPGTGCTITVHLPLERKVSDDARNAARECLTEGNPARRIDVDERT